jgi:hypothetical protein
MKPWTYTHAYPVEFYYTSSKLRIILTEGFISHNCPWIDKIKSNDVVFCVCPCFCNKYLFQGEIEEARTLGVDLSRIFFLLGTKEDVTTAREAGLNAEYINHNCFLSEKAFFPKAENKLYDAMLVTRALKLKRVHLAAKVKNLALVITDENPTQEGYAPIPKLDSTVFKSIPQNEIHNRFCQSFSGLFLSEQEGACFSSGECLLSGTPVVSTPSQGGREVWYNEDNSIVCDPNEESVKEAVESAKRKVLTGQFNSLKIHGRHVKQGLTFRQTFVDLTQKVFKRFSVDLNAKEYFLDTFRHKMYQNYRDKEQAVKLIEERHE